MAQLIKKRKFQILKKGAVSLYAVLFHGLAIFPRSRSGNALLPVDIRMYVGSIATRGLAFSRLICSFTEFSQVFFSVRYIKFFKNQKSKLF